MKDVGDLEVNNWNEIFNTKKFWQEYYDYEVPFDNNCLVKLLGFDEDEYRASNTILSPYLEVSFPQNFSLVLSFSLTCTYIAYLELKFPQKNNSFSKILIGWDDGAHWHPDFFRLEEFQNIIKFLETLEQAELKCDPKFVPLLLRKFTPLTQENKKVLLPLTKEVIKKTGLFSQEEVEKLAKRRGYIRKDFHWKFQPNFGWLHEGMDGYSTRSISYLDVMSAEEAVETKTLLGEVRKFFQALYQELGVSDPA